jgi:hypothetical protein
MSIKLMSAIFETEMRDMPYTKDGQEHKAKASTAKLVLLALADHANDYGDAFPGYSRLEIKTCLSRQGIADTLEALKQNGLLSIGHERSRMGTNDYTINIRAFPAMHKEADELPAVVKPLEKVKESSHLTTTSQATLPEVVKPLDHNHHSTINKPPSEKDWIDGMIELAGMPGAKKATIKQGYVAMIESKLHINPTGKRWEDFVGFAADRLTKNKEPLDKFLAWALTNGYDPRYWTPDKMRELWPQAFMQDAPKLGAAQVRQVRLPSGL